MFSLSVVYFKFTEEKNYADISQQLLQHQFDDASTNSIINICKDYILAGRYYKCEELQMTILERTKV
jgi:hypothetical protein